MNEYFQHQEYRLRDGLTARGQDVNNPMDQVEQGFDKLPGPTALQYGTVTYGTAISSGTTYVITLPIPATGYVDGMQVIFRAPITNTGACTINVSGLGQRSIRRSNNGELIAGEIIKGRMIHLRYNSASTRFELQSVTLIEATQVTQSIVDQAQVVFASMIASATYQADRAKMQADMAAASAAAADISRQQSQQAADASAISASSAAQQATNVGSLVGINFGGWVIDDGELIVSHLTTTTPSLTDGDLTIEYEALEVI